MELITSIIKQYPCIHCFHYETKIVVYDAKANFSTSLSNDEFNKLKIFLDSEKKENSNLAENSNNKKLWLQCETLQKHGVFLPGPFTSLYTVDPNLIEQQIKQYSSFIVTRKFSLEVTQRCNFRCRYCPYTLSDANRQHNQKDMTDYVAFKAIDNYFEKYIQKYQSLNKSSQTKMLKFAPPGMGWYGGEPFLNFELIQKSHNHFISQPWEKNGIPANTFHFAITTNLSIINEKIIQFLLENNVICTVSLDGPPEENDKNRILINGNGTFQQVFENLISLYEISPEYFRNHVFFSSVFSQNNNFDACKEFFQNLPEKYGFPNRMRDYRPVKESVHGKAVPNIATLPKPMGFLANNDPRIVDIDKIPDPQSQIESNSNPTFKYFLQLTKSFRDISFDHPQGTNKWIGMRTCPMSFDVLFIDACGNYHMCEKTDQSLPLGNIIDGIDFQAIFDAYLKFNTIFNKNACKKCWAVHFCKICAATILLKGEFIPPMEEECKHIRSTIEIDLYNFFNLLLTKPKLFTLISSIDQEDSTIVDITELHNM